MSKDEKAGEDPSFLHVPLFSTEEKTSPKSLKPLYSFIRGLHRILHAAISIPITTLGEQDYISARVSYDWFP